MTPIMPAKSTTKLRKSTISPERLEALDLHRVMSMIPIMPYHTVADISSGTGHFAIPLAKYVFDGRVCALDSSKATLEVIQETVDKFRLGNVETILNKGKKLQLANDSMDGVLAPFVFSSDAHTANLLKEIYRVLHSGGWMAALEWNDVDSNDAPPKNTRIATDKLQNIAEKTRFRFTASYHLDKDQYMLLMRK